MQCNGRLIAPNRSEYVSERHVRHSWSCESCGQEFVTSDYLEFGRTTKARTKFPSLTLLVA